MNLTNKNILWGLGSVVLIFASLWVVWKMTTKTATDPESEAQTFTITQDDNVKGATDAPITLVEYSDFQCPACRLYAPTVKQVIEENEDVRLVYRHFPLDQHEFSHHAARAAQAAGRQGKFFEMHDLLFEKQDDWAESKNIDTALLDYARSLKLNLDQFKKDYNSAEIKDKVDKDYKSGLTYKVSSTPSFYLDGISIQPQSAADFNTLIETARKRLPKENITSSPSGTITKQEPTKTTQ